MNGFEESPYKVERTSSIQHYTRTHLRPGHQVPTFVRKIELRVSEPQVVDPELRAWLEARRASGQPLNVEEKDTSDRYLAISDTDPTGKCVRETLLLYPLKVFGKNPLEDDWLLLGWEPTRPIEDEQMQWLERVEWHGTGFRKDGRVRMY